MLVRNNRIATNTLGIGLASSRDIDITGNEITHNSMGILLINVPGDASAASQNTRIFNNKITENNRNNLYSSAAISQRIYTGVGIHLLGVDKVEIFANALVKNNASNLVIFSDTVEGFPDLLEFDPYTEAIYVHNNVMDSTGMAPSNLTNLRGVSLNLPYPDVLYDGQIVGNEEVRKRELLLQFDQKIENLALNRNIEC